MEIKEDMTKDESDMYWFQLIEEQEQSGLSIAEWVRQKKGISYNQFISRRRRLLPLSGITSEFLNEETTWTSIKMEIPTSTFDVYINECKVVVKSGFNKELLSELLDVLKQ